ncbi:hypothetical protein KSP35_18300 [Aquihabitans sp. G128]|uniref:hypothetical protein n=1 Tax=Aquihabitans sp. G128 TaxID=2849779 RepID=UPI001C23E3C7|nr:hypothetical protein [Aquihabitans sp. G128]QXC60268.1 hypothetical protein KSP35_18300 [Aquihabitans sp. G128]
MIVRRRAVREGTAVHWRFRPRPGSDYVASGFALGAVIDLVERRRPASILEVGAGIGTLTTAVAEAAIRVGLEPSQVAVEEIDFCLEQLDANLGSLGDRVRIVRRAADVPAEVAPYELVVIDGGATTDLLPEDQPGWTAQDERAEVAAWIGRLAPGAIVVVENERAPQRSHIEAEATRPYRHEHVRPVDGSPGLHLYQFDPTPGLQARARVRDAVRALWFPRGLRLLRRAHLVVLRRSGPDRAAVAPGGDSGA